MLPGIGWCGAGLPPFPTACWWLTHPAAITGVSVSAGWDSPGGCGGPSVLIPSSLPQYPFQKVGVDLCEKKGENYLVAIDYYSRYIELAKLSMITSAAVVQELKEIRARQGIPEILDSDNNSQFFSKEFKDFTVTWGITHVTSSPKFPHSNSEAERAVQTVKQMLDQPDVSLAFSPTGQLQSLPLESVLLS